MLTTATLKQLESRLLRLATAMPSGFVLVSDHMNYHLALQTLGDRSAELYRGFVELERGGLPNAARAALRPLVEIDILIRFLGTNPTLHAELWEAEGERNKIAMVEEYFGPTETWMEEPWFEPPLDIEQLDEQRTRVAEARAKLVPRRFQALARPEACCRRSHSNC